MTRKGFYLGLFTFAAAVGILWAGCSGSRFKETDNGLKYRFHVKNEDSTRVKLYDIVEVYMNYRTRDSLLYDGGKNKIPFQVNPVFEGDLMEGIMLMHKGDSATFIMTPEDFFLKMMNYQEMPQYAKGVEEMYFDVKVANIKPEPESLKATRLENKSRKQNEMNLIRKYLDRKDIKTAPTQEGLYYIEKVEGTGDRPVPGKKIAVHYTGRFLNGDKFDSSYDRGEPIEFVLGRGEVIEGWDIGISKMKEGGKAMLIIPSRLGYGDQQRGTIKPYTPLVFEVELVKILD